MTKDNKISFKCKWKKTKLEALERMKTIARKEAGWPIERRSSSIRLRKRIEISTEDTILHTSYPRSMRCSTRKRRKTLGTNQIQRPSVSIAAYAKMEEFKVSAFYVNSMICLLLVSRKSLIKLSFKTPWILVRWVFLRRMILWRIRLHLQGPDEYYFFQFYQIFFFQQN